MEASYPAAALGLQHSHTQPLPSSWPQYKCGSTSVFLTTLAISKLLQFINHPIYLVNNHYCLYLSSFISDLCHSLPSSNKVAIGEDFF
jgi:hypothetical protein